MIIPDESLAEIRKQCRIHGFDPDSVDGMVFAAGVAAGRAQAAADIRAAWDTRDSTDWLAGASWAAKIAGGEPRG